MTAEIEQYDELSVIWDGALAEIVTVWDDTIVSVEYGGMGTNEGDTFASWLARIEADANQDQAPVEITCVTHYHAPDFDGECACAQYATDHRPVYTFNIDDE